MAAAAAAAHYQPLDAKYPDSVRAPSVSRCGYSGSSPDFSSSRLGRASAKRDKSVERNNGSGNLRRSERISSRAPSVEPSARGGKPRGRSAVRSGASSGESSGYATPKTPTDWNSPTSLRSTDEVLSQVRSHLHRNSEYTRGDSPEPDDLDEYRYLDPSRCGSPTNEDDIVTAGEGQAPFRGRKYQEESCVCTGVEGPNGVFTNTRSRSSSRAQEAARNGSEMKKARDTRMRSRSSSRAPDARNGSDSSKAKSKKAKDIEKSSKPSSASGAKADDGKHWEKEQYSKSRAIYYNYSFSLMSLPASFAQTATE